MSKKDTSIHLKLAKARNLLEEVDVLMQHKFYMTAINRLYYSCFHATKALLLTKDLAPKTHSGVTVMLHQQFVQNGSFDFEQASFFSRSFPILNNSSIIWHSHRPSSEVVFNAPQGFGNMFKDCYFSNR